MSMILPPIVNLNNMIDNEKARSSIINKINECKIRSETPLIDNQIAYIPVFEDNQIEYMTFDYYRNGLPTVVNQSKQCCFKCRYLKFKYMSPRKAYMHSCGTWNINELVDDEVIEPFMLFINGRFIPWKNIYINTYYGNYYILVDMYDSIRYGEIIRDIKYAQIITVPSYVRCVTDYNNTTITDNTLFSFEEFGLYSTDSPVHRMVTVSDKHFLLWNFYTSSTGVSAFRVTNNTTIKLTGKNVITFTDGLLTSGYRDNIKRGFEDEAKDRETGETRTFISFKISDEPLTQNPEARFDSELLTIGNGRIQDDSIMNFGIFINTKYHDTIDNINKVDMDALTPYVLNQNAGIDHPQFLKDLQVPFNMEMSRQKYYDENVANSIKTMMSYNSSLFNSVFKENSNLVIETYRGEDVINFSLTSSDPGAWVIYRQYSNSLEEYFLILVNGELYRHIGFAKYKANTWNVPIQDINQDDTVELLRFQNVNNNEISITINETDGFLYYSPDIINKNMVLFSEETDDEYFEFPEDGLQHFSVDYTLEYNDEGYIKIVLTNPFYYGKKLIVASKDRFKHFNFRLKDGDVGKYKVDLGPDLKYCNEYSKYLIFYNGRRLNSDNFRLALPTRSTTPFYRFSLYLTMPVNAGDIVDVVYVPSLMKDVTYQNAIPENGNLIVNKSDIGYGLSTYLYMVWINGKKIPESYITDIDSTHLKIITDTNTIDTMSITMYIPEIDILSNAFSDNEVLWDKVFAQLTNAEICALLGIEEINITNTEPNIYADAINIRSIMFELIREEFIMNPRVDITAPFVYDYQDVDNTAIESYDSGGNAILSVSDANRIDNLDDVERPW